jgi:hypothetical protein
MKAIETIGIIDQKGQIILTQPLNLTPESQVKVIVLFSDLNIRSSEAPLKSAVESFSQGWKEAMIGKTHPIDELWVGIEHE